MTLRVVVGVGASSRATAAEIAALVADALTAAGLTPAAVIGVATVDARQHDTRLAALGWPVTGFRPDQLEAAAGPVPSGRVRAAVGTGSVAEAAALLAAGPGARLLVGKHRSAHATVAVAAQPHFPREVASSTALICIRSPRNRKG